MRICAGQSLQSRLVFFICAAVVSWLANELRAGTYYWDVNGSTAGAASAPSGTWGTGSTWTTNSSGTSITLVLTTSSTDSLYFVAGAGAASGNSAYDVTVNGNQNAYSITFASSGAAMLSGTGTINIGAGGITVPVDAYGSTSQGAVDISTSISLQGSQTWRSNSSSPFTIDGNVYNNGNLWTIGGAGNTTFSGYLSGSGGLTKIGNGMLTLQSPNDVTGTTTMISGTLNLSDGYALQSSTLVASSGVIAFDKSVIGGVYYVGALSGSGNIVLQNNAASPFAITLNVGGNNAMTTFSGNLSGSGSLVFDDGGMLTMTGTNNTYSGGTTVTSGTLALKAPGALPNFSSSAALLSVASGGMLTLSLGGTGWTTANVASLVAANHGGFSAGSILGVDTTSATGAMSFSGTLSGNMSLAKLGANMLSLATSSNFTGSTTINGGTLDLVNSNALQGSTLIAPTTGVLEFDPSIHAFTLGGLSGSGNLSLQNGASVALTVGNNNTSTVYSGVLSGSGSLVKTGSGALVLIGTNSYSGGTTINAGSLQLGNGTSGNDGVMSNTGGIIDNSALVYNLYGNQTYAGIISGSGVVLQNGGSALVLTNTNSYSGGTSITSGTLQLGTGSIGQDGVISGSGGVFNNATLAFDLYGSQTYAGAISGSGSLSKTGSGILTLGGTSSILGSTTISGGTLDLANSGALQLSTLVAPTSGALVFDRSVTGSAFILGGLSGSGSLVLRNNATSPAAVALTVGGNNTSTIYTGSLSGTGSLAKKGAGTLTLTGSNSLSSLSISGGGVVLAGTGSLTMSSTGQLYIGASGPGAMTFQDNSAVTVSELDVNYLNTSAGASSLTITGGAIHVTGQTYIGRAAMRTDPSNISAAVYQSGGVVSLAQAATIGYNGTATSIYNIEGGVLSTSGGLTVGGNLGNGTGQGNGELNILGSAVVNVAGGGGLYIGQDSTHTTSGNVNLSSGTLAVSGNLTFGSASDDLGIGSLSRSGGVMTVSGNLIVDGNATITLDDTTGSVATSFGGSLLRNGQGTLVVVPVHGDMSSGTSGEALRVATNPAPGGSIVGPWLVRQLSSSDSGGDYLTSLSSSGSYLLVTTSYSSTLSTSSTASVVAIASSTTLTQNVAISALKLGPYSMSISGTGGLTLESGGLIINGGTLSGNGVSFSNVMPMIYAGSSVPSKISSSLISDIGLTKFGAGSLNLAANNSSLEGSIYVSAGTLIASNSGAFGTGGASTVSVAASGSLAIEGNTVLANVPITINGTGSGAGSLINLQDNNSLAGTLNLGSNSLINTASANLVLSGSVQGPFSVTKSGSGTLVLAGASGNQFPLLVTVTAGSLRVQNTQGLGLGGTLGVIVDNGASLQFQGGIAVPSIPLTLNGVGASGNGSLENLQGANSSSGAITLAANSQVDVDSGSLALSGNINGGYALTQGGTGALQLSGNNSFTGALTVLSGTLSVPSLNSAGSAGPLGAGTAPVSLGSSGLAATLLYTGAGATTNRAFTLVGNGGVFQSNANIGISGVINGNGSLTTTGSGVLTLTGSNQYTGGTYVNAGSVAVGAGGSITASSGLFVAQGALLQVTAGTTGGSQLPNRGNLSLSGGTLSYAANGTYWPGESVGALILNPGQSQLVLSNAGTGTPYLAFASGTTHITGATVGFSASNAQFEFITSPPAMVGGILPYAFYGPANSTTVDFATLSATSGLSLISALAYTASTQGNISTMSLGSPLNVAATGTLSTMTAAHEFNSLKLNSSSSLSMTGTAALTLDSGGLICTGASTAITGGTISAPSGELVIDTATNLSIASVLSASNALVKTGTATLILSSLRPIAGNTFINQGTLNYAPTGSLTYGGVISGAGNLLLSGTSSALTLSGSDTYYGNTSVTAGTLSINGVLAGNGGVTIQSGVVLAGSGTIDGNVTVTGGIIAQSSTAAKIVGTVTVGSGTLTVGQAGVGNYLTTTGGLFITNSGALVASSSAANIASSLIYTSSGNSTFAGQISGTGSVLTLNAPSSTMLTLSNSTASTFGGVVLESGILKLATTGALGGNLVTLSGGTLDLDGLNAAPILLSGTSGVVSTSKTGSVTLDLDPGGSLSYGGKIANGSGTVGLVMSSSGLQTLSGTNTFTGGLTVSLGTVALNGASSLMVGTSLTIGNSAGPGAVFSFPSDNQNIQSSASAVSPVPEPCSGTLLLVSAVGIAVLAMRRRMGR